MNTNWKVRISAGFREGLEVRHVLVSLLSRRAFPKAVPGALRTSNVLRAKLCHISRLFARRDDFAYSSTDIADGAKRLGVPCPRQLRAAMRARRRLGVVPRLRDEDGCLFAVRTLHGGAKPISIGALGCWVFTITALSGCTATSLYLICSFGFRENSWSFLTSNSRRPPQV